MRDFYTVVFEKSVCHINIFLGNFNPHSVGSENTNIYIFVCLSDLQSCCCHCVFSLKVVAVLNTAMTGCFTLLQNTGIPLDVAARLQINMLLQENSYFS